MLSQPERIRVARVIVQHSQFEKVITPLERSTPSMSHEPPVDNGVYVFLYDSSAAEKHCVVEDVKIQL